MMTEQGQQGADGQYQGMEGPPPEIEVDEEKGTVEVVQDTPPPEEPTGEEPTPPSEEPTEPPPQTDDFDAKFKEAGLDKYWENPQDMLNRAPDLVRWANQLSRENAELKKGQTPEVTQDTFYDNPKEAVKATASEYTQPIQRRLDELEAKVFISSKGDFEKLQPAMGRELEKYPGLKDAVSSGAMSPAQVIEILYSVTKASQIPEIVKAAKKETQPAPADRQRAETSTGKAEKRPPQRSLEDWIKMTPEQIEKEIGFDPNS